MANIHELGEIGPSPDVVIEAWLRLRRPDRIGEIAIPPMIRVNYRGQRPPDDSEMARLDGNPGRDGGSNQELLLAA